MDNLTTMTLADDIALSQEKNYQRSTRPEYQKRFIMKLIV